MASERTVKVRIAVAVDEKGNWYGLGSPKIFEDVRLSIAEGEMNGRHASYWLEADLPVPIPVVQTVAASVEEVDSGE